MGGRDLAPLISGFRVSTPADAIGVVVLGSVLMLDLEVVVGENAQPPFYDGPGAVHGAQGSEGGVVRAPDKLPPILEVIVVLLHIEDPRVQLALCRRPSALALVDLLAPVADDNLAAVLVLAEDAGDLLRGEVGVKDKAPSL